MVSNIVGVGCSFVQGSEIPKGKSFIDLLGGLNLGDEGIGNTGAVTRALMADIPRNSTIIFMPTGLNRVDIFKAEYNDVDITPFVKIFPNIDPVKLGDMNKFNLERAMAPFVSLQTEVLNATTNIINMQNFCKVNGHKLIMFPAFSREYTKKYFCNTIEGSFPHKIDWDKFITIDGCSNFFDWTIKQSGAKVGLAMKDMQINPSKYKIIGDWIMPRLHPSEKAHKLFAETICKFL